MRESARRRKEAVLAGEGRSILVISRPSVGLGQGPVHKAHVSRKGIGATSRSFGRGENDPVQFLSTPVAQQGLPVARRVAGPPSPRAILILRPSKEHGGDPHPEDEHAGDPHDEATQPLVFQR